MSKFDRISALQTRFSYPYPAGTLSFKLIALAGNVLTGTVQDRNTTHCDRINCFFCIEMIRNIGCLPPTLQYFIVGLMTIISGLVIYLRATLAAFYSVLRGIIQIFPFIYRLLVRCFRFPLRIGARSGTFTRQNARSAFLALSSFTDAPSELAVCRLPNGHQLRLDLNLLLAIFFITVRSLSLYVCRSFYQSRCTRNVTKLVLSSTVKSCEIQNSGKQSGTLDGAAQIVLQNIGSTSCIFSPTIAGKTSNI